jgi:glycerol kinase
MHVLAIDQGTSSTKALVVAPGGVIVGEGSAPVRPRASRDGAVVQDPEELYQSVLDAGRAALAAAGVPVAAVGVGNQGETVLAWDPATGRPLGDAISWQDRRAAGLVRRLAAHGDRLAELTGLPLDPYFAAPKMAWLRDQLDQPATVTTIDAWVNRRLTGACVTDAATASRTMLLELDSGRWSDEACALFGLDPAAQPEVVGNAPAGLETSAFGASLPLTGLCVDQQAALLAQSCLVAGEAKCTYGTGAFILANCGTAPTRSSAGLAACVAWRLSGETDYCLDGQVYTAGAAVSWLERTGLIADPQELDAEAAGMPPPVAGPLFIPALAGLGAPHWAPDARGGWLELSLATERRELIDAVLWGIAAQVTGLAGAIARDLGRPLQTLRVDGGLTRSRRLMQAQADLLQVPVEVYPSPDATALGIAALARLGCSGDDGTEALAAAVGEWAPSATYEPSLGADDAAAILARHERGACALIELAGAGG